MFAFCLPRGLVGADGPGPGLCGREMQSAVSAGLHTLFVSNAGSGLVEAAPSNTKGMCNLLAFVGKVTLILASCCMMQLAKAKTGWGTLAHMRRMPMLRKQLPEAVSNLACTPHPASYDLLASCRILANCWGWQNLCPDQL